MKKIDDNTYLMEVRPEMVGRKKVIKQFYLKSINEETVRHINNNRNSEKYNHVLLLFTDIESVKDSHLYNIIKKTYDRWHEVGNPLNTNPGVGVPVTQGWYSASALLELMAKEIEKKFGYVIYVKEK